MLGRRVGIGEERGERCRFVFFPILLAVYDAAIPLDCECVGVAFTAVRWCVRESEREREQHTPFVYAGRVEGFDAMAICGPYSWLCRRCLFVCVLARGVVHFYIYDAVAIA